MRTVRQIPLRRLATGLLRGAGLAALTLVLAVHPAAGSHDGGAHGMAGLLRALLCGCAECAGEKEPVALAAPSCCGHVDEVPAARAPGCAQGGACTCSHPDEVPVPQPGPLAAASEGGAGADPLTELDSQGDAAARTPCLVSGGVLLQPAALVSAPPADPGPAVRGDRRHGARPVDAPAAGTRLARLSTLLL